MSAGNNFINYINNSIAVMEAPRIRSLTVRAQTQLPKLKFLTQISIETSSRGIQGQAGGRAGAEASLRARTAPEFALEWSFAGSHHNCILSGQSQHRIWSRSECANIHTRLNIKYADICSQANCIVLGDLEFIIYRSYRKESELFELMHTCLQSERTIRISNFISLSFSV